MSDPGILPEDSVTVSGTRGETGVIRPQRNIGGVTADVTIEEVGVDETAITQHPVEKTADITDHAYSLPAQLTVRVAWSPSGSGGGGFPFSAIPGIGDPVPLQTIYDQFLAMQVARELMEVQTGKRLYENMLIKTITLVTDRDTENALFLVIGLQEVILVETQTVAVPQNSVQKQPEKTANTVNAGTKQAKPNPPTYNRNALVLVENRNIAGAYN